MGKTLTPAAELAVFCMGQAECLACGCMTPLRDLLDDAEGESG